MITCFDSQAVDLKISYLQNLGAFSLIFVFWYLHTSDQMNIYIGKLLLNENINDIKALVVLPNSDSHLK